MPVLLNMVKRASQVAFAISDLKETTWASEYNDPQGMEHTCGPDLTVRRAVRLCLRLPPERGSPASLGG
ncbi:hypothetical protein HPB48_024359 [Haemaphysalis longicornis]|uniref:Uncharacterized protein n=1 Tax=Haemaphysalis longicornis TaxID=44386 RepID=A0A9J6H852_HAELO|nr:hypothetical protein HPB48_024359 [Haemaphysalis longicornis]